MKKDITQLQTLADFAQMLAQKHQFGAVFALTGNLGSGKTQFTKLLAQALGITQQVTSPTFTIIQRYDWKPTAHFFHLDLYRLKNEQEVAQLGFEEIIADPSNFVVIEWPEKVLPLLPATTIYLHFELDAEENRFIIIPEHYATQH